MSPLRDTGVEPEAEHPGYAGQYRLEARLGAGGMGEVHLARSPSGLPLAVKVIHAEFAQDPEFRGRFRQEVAAARRVSGAFTAPVVDADPDADRPWMATLHISGPTLAEQVKRNGPLPPGEVRALACGLAEALRDIHRAGVVHRDLKPSNVLLAADGPKVIDFGISRPSDSEMRTETGKLIGTPPFMAPEQFQRPREVGPQADVFALGSVLVHAATGRGPFDSDSPYLVAYQVVHDEADLDGVPEELTPLIAACLAKDPADRPTPRALMDRLRTDLPTEIHLDLWERLAEGGPSDTPVGLAATPRIPGQAGPPDDSLVPGKSGTPGRAPAAGWPAADAPSAAVTHVRDALRDVTEGEPGAGPEDAFRGGTESGAGPAFQGGTDPDAIPGTAFGGGTESGAGAAFQGGTDPDAEAPARPSDGVPGAARRPRRRLLIWAAAALATALTGGFVIVHAASGDGTPRRPAASPSTAFHPWRTTLLPRPAGYEAEMPACAAGSGGAVFCTQRGVSAARLDPATGTVVWRRAAPPPGKTDTAPPAPQLSGGLLYVTSADRTELSALDPSAEGRGRTRWSLDLTAYQGGAAVAGNTVLLTAADGTVTALDSATHRTRWHRAFAGHALPSFRTYGADSRTAYAAENSADGTSTQVTAVDPASGEVRWHARLPGMLTVAGAGASGSLYLTVGEPQLVSRTTAVVRYDPQARRSRRFPLAAPLDGVLAAVRGETAYLLAEGGALQAVGARTWDVETSVARGSAPVVTADDRLYFSSADGRLLSLDARNGELTGQTPPRLKATRHHGFLETVPAPAPYGDRVFGASPDGTVLAAAAKDPASW
ncbi:serine/threonine-protein kinase [Streptomyces catenulae]|uniref:Serine/threonine-protein kinase n=1 Tax=Streptomyces catenulae TaxID=66875 RepID=A0ABV2Z7R2_9ACTN|nr:serine/threonine-protein kinase [Streptomyces catenulae]